MESKPASLLVSLGKTLNGMLPFLCGRQVAGPNNLPVVAAQFNWRLAKRSTEKLSKNERSCPYEEKEANNLRHHEERSCSCGGF